MNDTEQKARDMVRKEGRGHLNYDAALAALCRAIEQHEAFRQEVSDAAQEYEEAGYCMGWEGFERFIIPAPKHDPLVEVLDKMLRRRFLDPLPDVLADEAHWLRAELEARGLEIREKNDDQ